MNDIQPQRSLECMNGLFMIGLAVVLASCDGHSGLDTGHMTLPATAATRTWTQAYPTSDSYFGTQFEAEEQALQESPVAEPIQTF